MRGWARNLWAVAAGTMLIVLAPTDLFDLLIRAGIAIIASAEAIDAVGFSPSAIISAFLGGFVASKLAGGREFLWALLAVLLAACLQLALYTWAILGSLMTLNMLGPFLLRSADTSLLMVSLLAGFGAAWLARRHRLRREARADQAIIDAF